MALTIPTQAIKFLGETETPFNDKIICGCEVQEDWSYLYTEDDSISFQIAATQTEGEDFIKNGSFEQGESSTSITDWTRSVENAEQTNVNRDIDNSAPCGQYSLHFENFDLEVNPTYARVTQALGVTLESGKTYKVTLKSKIVAPTFLNGNADILKVTLGGEVKYITPTTNWEEYTLTYTFNTPSDNNLIIEINDGVLTDTSEMFVDCVSALKIEDCSVTQHINNGCFEDGQKLEDEVGSTADNWVTSPPFSFSEDGGYDGTRCALLVSSGDTLEQYNCLNVGYYTLKFWAKSEVDPSNLIITTPPSSVQIANITVATTWQQYSITFTNTLDTDLLFFQNTDTLLYIDCVELYSYPDIDIYIKDSNNDIVIPVNKNSIEVYDNAINVDIEVNNYNMPSCFQICVTTCFSNLFKNGDFEFGVGNTFTDWTLTQPSRTNYVLNSQSLTSSFNGVIGTNDAIAPDGTMTADSFNVNDNTSGGTLKAITLVNGNTYTYSVWLKGSVNGQKVLSQTDFNGDLLTFTLTTEWVRYSVTFVANSSSAQNIYLLNGLYVTPTSNDIYYTWGQQLENGSFVTPNITTAGTTVTTSLGEFLQDENGGVDGGRALKMWVENSESITQLSQIVPLDGGANLFSNGDFALGTGNLFTNWTLTQPSRTNVLLRSQEFNDASWLKSSGGTGSNPIVTANFTEAPDGTMTADKIVFNSGVGTTGSDQSFVYQSPAASAGIWIGSIWLKGSAGGEKIVFRHVNATTYTLLTLTNQWARYSVSESYGTNNFEFGIRQAVVGTINSSATIYAWGAQLEQSGYATPYIPTTSTAVTTSLGEFLQDATGGEDASRCLKMWHSTGNTTKLIQSASFVAGQAYTLRFRAKVDAIGVDTTTTLNIFGNSGAISIGSINVSEEWQWYTVSYTPSTSSTIPIEFLYQNGQNYGFIYLDDVSFNLTSLNKQYTITFYAKLGAVYGNDFLNVNGYAVPLTSTSWERKEITFTQGYTGSIILALQYLNDSNYGFVYLDKMKLFQVGEEPIEICSENMKYTEQLDGCEKELVWYDTEEFALGINYASGFKNRVRLKAQLQNPNYLKEDYVKSLNGKNSFINSLRIRKTQDLSIDSVPEFIWDRMANMIAVSNIEYDNVELCSSIDTEISVNYDKNTLVYTGTVTLAPKGEYIVERSYNCS
jgi:hypothetical protein